MNDRDFQEGFPGRLVRTTFNEPSGGRLVEVDGLSFVPDPLPPRLDWHPLIGRLHPILDRTRTALTRLEGIVDSLPGRSSLISAMRTREAQASSRIENTFASLRDIAITSVDQSRASPDSLEVWRNVLAIEAGLASAWPLGRSLILEMHKVLIQDPRHNPGQFRSRQVCIGNEIGGFAGARFVPPPAHEVDGAMREWEQFTKGDRGAVHTDEKLPYFVELALAHYQFEAIHPFSDGNGRLGRALVALAPVKHRELRHPVCNLSEWIQAHRQEYYDRLLRVSTHAEWEQWIKFFCTALSEQARADTDRAMRVSALYERYMGALTKNQSSTKQLLLLDHVFDRRVTTITMASEAMKISYNAAKRHIDTFVREGILTPIEGTSHPQCFYAADVMRAIEGQSGE